MFVCHNLDISTDLHNHFTFAFVQGSGVFVRKNKFENLPKKQEKRENLKFYFACHFSTALDVKKCSIQAVPRAARRFPGRVLHNEYSLNEILEKWPNDSSKKILKKFQIKFLEESPIEVPEKKSQKTHWSNLHWSTLRKFLWKI